MTTRLSSQHLPLRYCALLLLLLSACQTYAQAPPDAVAAFQRYTATVEARLSRQHASTANFLQQDPGQDALLQHGDLLTEQLSPGTQPAGALLQHWRGTAFVPGATAAQFEHLLRDVSAYPRVFAPQVLQAHAQPMGRSAMQATLRVRQKYVITVVMDARYDVTFGQLDARDGYSTSRSTSIQEIDAPDTEQERALTPAEEHGFLWKLNTYWTFQQRSDGLYLQMETVSLSRALPPGLGWILRPYVLSVPQTSLAFTLRAAVDALRK